MRRLILAAVLILAATHAHAQCTQQTLVQLLNTFSNSAAPGSITPNAIANGFCSTINTSPVLTASLPTCGGGQAPAGSAAIVSDANSPTYGGTLTGGGSTYVIAICNGAAWKTH